MMDWKKLLSTKRIGQEKQSSEDPQNQRTAFNRDYDRIIFSSAFRRMQDKTQVFPLAKSDYVRTRLTHSLEVACVGRSLGMLAADIILSEQPELKEIVIPQDVGTIVATACLAHDIGNPPFGHAGESAIQEWFKTSTMVGINGAKADDLLSFEGNAQGFRTLCTLQQAPQPGGMQLTYAVLGTFTKYPRASKVEKAQTTGISGKKFGFMQSEAKLFGELAEEVGLVAKPGAPGAWYRHPLAFLVEAADDICYSVMDIEDGFKTGCVSYDEIAELHRLWLPEKRWQDGKEKIPNDQRRVEYFRATTVGQMIDEAVKVFKQNYVGLLDGSFDKELLSAIPKPHQFTAFKTLADSKVYCARPVIEIEACGFEVIASLLSSFVSAIETKANKLPTGKRRSQTLLKLMPNMASDLSTLDAYDRMLLATDFVAGMTDSFAVELYQRIRGISLP